MFLGNVLIYFIKFYDCFFVILAACGGENVGGGDTPLPGKGLLPSALRFCLVPSRAVLRVIVGTPRSLQRATALYTPLLSRATFGGE